jgi:hypothetical protein
LGRIQLCGRLVVELDGERVEAKLPGRQGRLLFAFLATHRERDPTRTEDAVHRAESAVALGEWRRAWGPAQVALFISRRGFLPGEAAHAFVGAGDGPCAILMVGARTEDKHTVYPSSDLARRHRAGVEAETSSPAEAYAPYPHWRLGRPDELPWPGSSRT